jgi:ribulose-phosphate 3-epimerase
MIISPSILSADFGNLQSQLEQIELGGADWIHVDVMDGHFVPNITMGPFIVSHCQRLSTLPLDVHLMIEKPENHIDAFIDAGASWLTIHIENNPNVHRTLQAIRARGVHPGIAINPGTPAHAIESILDQIDMVLVMTVNPGFSGQSHMAGLAAKVRQVLDMVETARTETIIQVDGGITADTLPAMFSAGARAFVAATAIFKNDTGIIPAIQSLRQSISD